MIIERKEYVAQLLNSRNNRLVKIITGVRRCGKSFLLFNLFKNQLKEEGVDKEHIIEMAFDDFDNRRYRKPDAFYQHMKNLIKDGRMYYVLLDEVQMMDDFEDVLNGLLHIENVDVFVTGSNAKFLSKDIITEFRGRGYQIHVSPLSFSEYMSVYSGGSREKGFVEYLHYGGLPPVVLQPTEEDKIKLLKNLWEETYLIDILNRNRIKNSAELEELLCMLASGIGGLVNPQKLSNSFKSMKNVSIGPATLKSYIGYCSDAFLIEESKRFDVKGKKYIGTPMKYYFSDMGLRNALLNFRQVERTHLMENAIYNDLRRQGFNVDVGVVVLNGKDEKGISHRKQLEVDFVCNKGSRRYYVQSALSLPTPEKMEQETNSLRCIGDSFERIVVVGDNVVRSYDNNGILFVSVYDFLMNDL